MDDNMIYVIAGIVLIAAGGSAYIGAAFGFHAGYKKGERDGYLNADAAHIRRDYRGGLTHTAKVSLTDAQLRDLIDKHVEIMDADDE